MKRQIVFIRHAHRDISNRKLDNGLSTKGIRQAARLRKFALQRFTFADFREGGALVLSSPKLRCVQTLEPLARAFDCPLKVEADLDEGKRNESMSQLNLRVQKFLKNTMADAPPLLFICSHGDWLPLAIYHLLGINVEMKKGAWLEMEIESNQAQLTWSIPAFKPFM